MRFEAKTREQFKEEKVLPEGEYAFEVEKAVDTQSKKGADMIALTLTVFTDAGEKRTVRDWMLADYPEKILGFAESTGIVDLYVSGAFAARDCVGLSGYVKLKVQTSEQYGSQNNVSYYVPAKSNETQASPGLQKQSYGTPVMAAMETEGEGLPF